MGVGTRLGAYEITGLLGAGGMGEVYRARDTNLGRDVAIKVLPAVFTIEANRVARLELEAKHTLIFGRGLRDDNNAVRLDVYALSLIGKSLPARLVSFPHQVGSMAVAPDDSAVVFSMIGASSADLWSQPLGRDGKVPDRQAEPFVATPANEGVLPCGFSPDGRWLAYSSNATGRYEIYVTDFPRGATQTPVTSAGGVLPCWSKDGRQIFYWNGHNTVMAVAVRSGATFAAEMPRPLFDSPVMPMWGYDVAQDGTFYVAGYEARRIPPIVFVSDITASLRSRASAQ